MSEAPCLASGRAETGLEIATLRCILMRGHEGPHMDPNSEDWEPDEAGYTYLVTRADGTTLW